MRAKTTLFLLAVTLGLVTFVLFFEPPTTPLAIQNSSKVVRFDTEMVSRIEITSPHGKAKLQKKKDGLWYIESPINDRIDPELMEKMLKEAGNLVIYDTLTPKEIKEDGLQPDDLGFGANKLSMKFMQAEETVGEIEIGERSELKDVSFMRKAGDWKKEPIHAAWSLVREMAEIPFNDMRDPNLLSGSAEQVREIKYAGRGSILVKWDLEKEHWMMEKPIQTRASKVAIDEKLAALLTTEIVTFLDESDAGASDAFQESPKEIRVWFHKRKGSTDIKLALPPAAEGDDFLYAKVSDRKGVFKLPKSILDGYTANPNDLRERNLGDFKENEISAIIIEQQWRDGEVALPIRLENFEGTWVMLRNSQREAADSVKISNMIKAINEEKIVNFAADAAVDLAPYGLSKPTHEVSFITRVITVPDDPESDKPAKIEDKVKKLQISPSPEGTKVYAKYEDEPFIYEIAFPLYDLFSTNKLINWKSPELLRFNMLALKGISVERHPNPPISLIYDVATNRWGAESNGKDLTTRLIEKRARVMLTRLSNLQAKKWTADIGKAHRAMQKPSLTIRLEVDNRENKSVDQVKLTFAPTNAGMQGDSFYGRINDSPDYFYISKEVFNALYDPMIGDAKPKVKDAGATTPEQAQN